MTSPTPNAISFHVLYKLRYVTTRYSQHRFSFLHYKLIRSSRFDLATPFDTGLNSLVPKSPMRGSLPFEDSNELVANEKHARL